MEIINIFPPPFTGIGIDKIWECYITWPHLHVDNRGEFPTYITYRPNKD